MSLICAVALYLGCWPPKPLHWSQPVGHLSQAVRAGFPCQLAGHPAHFPYRLAVRVGEGFPGTSPQSLPVLGSVHCLSGLESRMRLPVLLWRRTASWERVTRCQLRASGSAYPVKLSLKQRQEPTAVTLPSSHGPNSPLITLRSTPFPPPCVSRWLPDLSSWRSRASERWSTDVGTAQSCLGQTERNQTPSTKK